MKKIIFLATLLCVASVAFAQTRNIVIIEKTDGTQFSCAASDIANISFCQVSVMEIWKQMPELLGSTIESSRKTMADKNFNLAYSSTSYSLDGADYYSVSDNIYVASVAIAFNANHIAAEVWVYLNPAYEDDVYRSIAEEYDMSDKGVGTGEIFYYDESGTLEIVYNVMNSYVVYRGLSISPAIRENNWGGFDVVLGMTKEEVIEEFGQPYAEGAYSMMYEINASFAFASAVLFDENTGACDQVKLYVRSDKTSEDVVAVMNDEYTVYAPYTKADGSQYAWLNAKTAGEATMLIGYWPADGLVVYMPYGSSSAKQRFVEQWAGGR